MPEALREELGVSLGIVLTSKKDLVREIASSRYVVTVGDIVTLDILETGHIPDISIVDYMTKRMPVDQIKERLSRYKQPEIFVQNPAGQITRGMWNAIKDGYENPRHLRIVVDGEEDLASLVCISLAPPGTTVIYGIPNRGASVHHVDAELKHHVDGMLNRMELK